MRHKVITSILASALLFLSGHSLSAQERIIHGTVTTFEAITLANASIKVKSTKKEVYSDTLGKFTVLCAPRDRLTISANGFSSQKVKVDEQTKLVIVNLPIKPGTKNREIAIGYGHVTDEDKLDAIYSLDEQTVDYGHYSNIYDIIRGRFPGVEVQGNQIIISGGTSVHGSDAALLVVDGRVVNEIAFQMIAPAEIKSISVLKGAAATIYGSSGANGVILVETKKGLDD